MHIYELKHAKNQLIMVVQPTKETLKSQNTLFHPVFLMLQRHISGLSIQFEGGPLTQHIKTDPL